MKILTNKEKAEILKVNSRKLSEFKSSLNADNIGEFEILKNEILSLLDDNQKVKFNQIVFYKTNRYYFSNDDALPF